MKRRWGILPVLLLVCAGCGKTKRDVINEYRPRMDVRRAQLQEVAAKIPPPGAAPDRTGLKLAVVPTYSEQGKGNTVFLAREQMKDADAKPAFDFNLGGALLTCLQWTGPNNPMAASALKSSAGTLPQTFEEALGYRYVGVLRTLDYTKPVIVDEKTFRGGTLEVEVLFVDLETREVLTAFRVLGRSDDKVTVTFREGESPEARAEEYVRSTLWVNARRQIAQGLTERTGGTFALGQ